MSQKKRNITKKQRQRLISGAKIRKQNTAWIIERLNEGRKYYHPKGVVKTDDESKYFFHASKGQLQDAKQPSRYKGKHGARRV